MMSRMFRGTLLAIWVLTLLAAPALGIGCDGMRFVPLGTGEAQPIHAASPVYPQIAQATRTEGIVEVEVCVTLTGEAKGAAAVAGPAMLRPSAAEAAGDWRFRPSAAPFLTTLRFRFSAGRVELDNDRNLAVRYLDAIEKCYVSVDQGDPAVLSSCQDLIDIARNLDKWELRAGIDALALLGRANFDQRQFGEALRLYRQRLNLARQYPEAPGPIGIAYHDVARTLAASGNSTKEALDNYKKAEDNVSRAQKRDLSYKDQLTTIRQEYLKLLQQAGQSTKDLEKRISSER